MADRKKKGCYKNGKTMKFEGGRKTRRCPKRIIIDNPWINRAHILHGDLHGKVKRKHKKKFAAIAHHALSIISDAQSAHRAQKLKEARDGTES